MATKVGEAYVEIYGDLDRRRITSEAENAGKLGGSLFGDSFTKETERSFRASTSMWSREGTNSGKIFGDGFRKEVHDAVSKLDIDTPDFENLDIKVEVDKSELTALEESLRRLNLDTPELNVPVTEAMANIQRVKSELNELGRSTTNHQVRIDVEQALREVDKVEKNFGRFGVEASKGFVNSFGDQLHNFFRNFPADTYVKALMTPVGSSLVAIGAPIFTAAGATLGAALGAAILGAVGAVGLVGGIVLAFQDPRIEATFGAMGERMVARLKESTDGIKAHLISVVGTIENAFAQINFRKFFDTLAPLITTFGETFGRLAPQIDTILQKFAMLAVPIGEVAAQFLEKLVPAAERFVDKLAEHMPAIQSAFMFLGDVVIGLIDFLGDLIAKSAEVYETIALGVANVLELYANLRDLMPGVGENLGLTSDKARDMADNIRESGNTTSGLSSAMNDLTTNGLGPMGSKTEEVDTSLSGLKQTMKDVNQVVIDQNEAAEDWEETWDRVADSPTKFAGALDITTEAGRKNRDMLQQAAESSRQLALADIAAGVSAEEASKKHDQRTDSLVNENFTSGEAREEAKRLIEQYGAIPDSVITQIDAQGIPDAHAGTHRLIEKYSEVPKNVNTDLSVSSWGETNAQIDTTALKFDNLKGRSELAGGAMRTQATQTQTQIGTSSTGIQQSLTGIDTKTESTRALWDSAWTNIKSAAQAGGDFMNAVVLPAVGSFFAGMQGGADLFAQGWQVAWNNIGEIVRGGVNKAIEFINGLLAAFREVAGKFGLSVGGGDIGLIGQAASSSSGSPLPSAGTSGFSRLNKGGLVPGRGPNRDSVPAMLTRGEGVLSRPEMDKLGGASGFAALRGYIQGLNTGGIAGLDPEQAMNAAIIAQVAASMGLGPNAVHVALITALQESGLRNLSYGDRDSLGLFQQRPSQGWGTPEQIMDPSYSARKFFERLMMIPGWQAMPGWMAAQAVQISAFPQAYAKWEPLVGGILGAGGDILEMLFKPLFDLVARLKEMMPDFGGSEFGQMLRNMVLQLIEAGKKWVMDNFSFMGGGGGIGWKAMEELITKLVPGARVSSALRPGSRGSSGNLDYHHFGRAIDIVPSPGAIANAVVDKVNEMFKPATKELIHTPAGMKQIHNGRNATFSSDVAAGHYDHVHWAMDNGGVLPPHSDTLVRNSTNSSEYALTKKHLQDVVHGAPSGSDRPIQVTIMLDGEVIDRKIITNNENLIGTLRSGRR